MQKQNWFYKTQSQIISFVWCLSIAAIAMLSFPQKTHAQSQSDWQLQLERLHVIEAQEDDFLDNGDEPYFIVIRFGARYQESGSTYVTWSRYLEEDWASGVDDGDERTIPVDMGAVSYTDMDIITRDHFSCDDIMPQGGGALVIAMEHDQTPWNVIREIMDDLQQALEDELDNLAADGNLDLNNADAEVRTAVDRIVGSVSYDFWDSAEILARSFGFPDDFIDYHVFVFGAADPRVKENLEIPAISKTTIDVFSERQFEPLLFEGDGAKYEVSSSLIATLHPPQVPVTPPLIQLPAQFFVGTPLDFTATVEQGTDVTYDWVWGDGETGMCANASHIYNQAGEYTVAVTASNRDYSSTTSIVIQVSNLPYQMYLPSVIGSSDIP